MDGPNPEIATVSELLRALDARAAGLWRVEGAHLIQAAFVACTQMPSDVAREFATATRSVALSERTLGIVAAATTAQTSVSRASELDAASGSGRWLRAFGAERSVAVPLLDDDGNVVAVLSIALSQSGLPDDAVAARVRKAAQSIGA